MNNELVGSIVPENNLTGSINTVFGVDGKSAYQIAVDNGFVGTEAEWLESLKATEIKNGSVKPEHLDRLYVECRSRTTVNTYADLDEIISTTSSLGTIFWVMFTRLSPIKSVVGDGTFIAVKSATTLSLLLINIDNGEMWNYVRGSNEVTRKSITKEDLENLDIDNGANWLYYKETIYTISDLDWVIRDLTKSTTAAAHQVMLRFHVPNGSELAGKVQEGVCIGFVDIEYIDESPILRFINYNTGVVWGYMCGYPNSFEVISGAGGYSPTATVTQTANGALITITDKDGTTTATVVNGKDGKDGTDGQDGYTPVKGVDYFDGADGKSGVYVGSGEMPEGYNVQINPEGLVTSFGELYDQTYNPESENAQSGKAVAEAINTQIGNIEYLLSQI